MDDVIDDQIDFHDLGILSRDEIRHFTLDFLERSKASKFEKVRIITGKGSVVRPEVQKVLKNSKLVKKFKFAGYFSGQDGAIEVELKS